MVIFLDIDGVMVPDKSWVRSVLLTDGFPAFSSKATAVLQRLISDDTTILLTTSHKSRFTIPQWRSIFERRGIHIRKLKKLKNNLSYLSRKDEILNWYNTNGISGDFLIIDDDKSLNALPADLKSKLILTKPMIGLVEGDVVRIGQLQSN